ncbi:hypothetical protein NCLIV_029120 [Neospora caninum Liverpool]|uniref:DPH-type MB domain-containing protein n=1 Tax=Neospora caninum (strain Liverpool) TaxID=572307 RepID=F0VHD0_NEOCL|nr:hypothetical protein NCLIV_029120 [Neospora caninum Liverpool]CBZ53124.1 hypothetical protein NCLIV_029120 [Neospora caninum Liverpool]|eukprot:XP_003883156.1 hypothetical protein NCLIV_029120 [Neospora caninum Liverpool]
MVCSDYTRGTSSTSTGVTTTATAASSVTLLLQVPEPVYDVSSGARNSVERPSYLTGGEREEKQRQPAGEEGDRPARGEESTAVCRSQGIDPSPGSLFFAPSIVTQFRSLRVGRLVSGSDDRTSHEGSPDSGGREATDSQKTSERAEGDSRDRDEQVNAHREGERERSAGNSEEQVTDRVDHDRISDEVGGELYYERVSLREFEYDASSRTFFYPCPCGDLFEVPLETIRAKARETADCPTGDFRSSSQGDGERALESDTGSGDKAPVEPSSLGDQEVEVEASCPSCSLKVQAFFTLKRGAGEDGPVRAAKQQKVGGAYEGTSQQDHGLLLFRHVGEPPVLLAAATETVGNPEDSRTPSAERRVGPQGGAKEEASAGRPSNEDTCLGDVQAALQRLRKYRVVPPAGGAADHDADTQGEGPHEPSVSASREAGQKSRGRAGAVQRLKLADAWPVQKMLRMQQARAGCATLLEKERGETLSAQAELIRQLIAGGASANLADSVGADAMGLIELEDVDEETGEVLRGCRWGHCRSVDVFLGEFGDIDDPDSDDPDGAELDYPEDSDDDRERRFAARVRHLIDSDDDERAYSVSSDLSGFSEE